LKKLIIISSTSGANGEGFQLLNELKFIRTHSDVKIDVYINNKLTKEYLDAEIIRYANLYRFEVFRPSHNCFWRKLTKVKHIGLLIRKLRFQLIFPNKKNKFIVIGLVNLKAFLELTTSREIVFWHNTHKVQYCDRPDGKYLSVIYCNLPKVVGKLRILLIDDVQLRETRSELGYDIYIKKFNLKV
jgi:hypothetical protein